MNKDAFNFWQLWLKFYKQKLSKNQEAIWINIIIASMYTLICEYFKIPQNQLTQCEV